MWDKNEAGHGEKHVTNNFALLDHSASYIGLLYDT